MLARHNWKAEMPNSLVRSSGNPQSRRSSCSRCSSSGRWHAAAALLRCAGRLPRPSAAGLWP
eukprot:365766-Chlamydomonas_euryale.AAC.12